MQSSPRSQHRFHHAPAPPFIVVVLLFLNNEVPLECLFVSPVLVVLHLVQEWLQSRVRYAHGVISLVGLGVVGD
jgi:hypothetical protein